MDDDKFAQMTFEELLDLVNLLVRHNVALEDELALMTAQRDILMNKLCYYEHLAGFEDRKGN